MKYFVLLILFVSGCATARPDFKSKNETSAYGYKVEDSATTDQFAILTYLPPTILTQEYWDYSVTAAGQTCAARGFDYFDVSWFTRISTNRDLVVKKQDVYCLKGAKQRGLAIQFDEADRNDFNSSIIVLGLNNKSNSKLKRDDLVLMVNKTLVADYSELVRAIYAVVKNPKAQSVAIDIVREGKTMTIQEPIVDSSGFTFGPDDLKSYRGRVGAKE